MPDTPQRYARFLERLNGYERIEPFPSHRRPDKLTGIRALLERLGHPEQALRVIHAAGTNGKGMTSAMIARLLGRRGKTWGLYTSPHVVDIRERVVLNGRWISEPEFAGAGHTVLDVADIIRAKIHLSYFDLLTAIGLLAFRDAGVEWAVLETGLGGTADATNVTPKELAVITRIGLDHMYVLGNTLQQIAGEKLGIVRPGIPVVLAEQDDTLAEWLPQQAQERGAKPVASTEIRLQAVTVGDGLEVTWQGAPAFRVDYPAAEFTDVRRQCAATALVAVERALGPADAPLRPKLVIHALATQLPGRLERRACQRVAGLPGVEFDQIVLDGGHNGPALAALGEQLSRWGITDFTLIFGAQADKLVDAALPPLRVLLAHAVQVITLAPQTARAATSEALGAFLQSAMHSRRVPHTHCTDAADALRAAGEHPRRPLVVTGSFWMLGDVMRLLKDTAADTGSATHSHLNGE